jgi:hypothetical protein
MLPFKKVKVLTFNFFYQKMVKVMKRKLCVIKFLIIVALNVNQKNLQKMKKTPINLNNIENNFYDTVFVK